MMRIRTKVGIALAGTAAAVAVVGGVASATADESEPTLKIVQDEQRTDCPEDSGTAPSPEGTGL